MCNGLNSNTRPLAQECPALSTRALQHMKRGQKTQNNKKVWYICRTELKKKNSLFQWSKRCAGKILEYGCKNIETSLLAEKKPAYGRIKNSVNSVNRRKLFIAQK